MRRTETQILLPAEVSEVPEATIRLCSDLTIGGILLRQLLKPYDVERLAGGAEFGSVDTLRSIKRALKTVFSEPGKNYKAPVTDRGMYHTDHDWHLSVTTLVPKLKIWTHLRGSAELSVARANSLDASTGFGFSDEEIQALAAAQPMSFVAEAGDVFVFVDFGGCFTGTSTYHKVLNKDLPRLSRGWDITFH